MTATSSAYVRLLEDEVARLRRLVASLRREKEALLHRIEELEAKVAFLEDECPEEGWHC